jgi:hypothetical protein
VLEASPAITSASISRSGQTLTANRTVTGKPDVTVACSWQRCSADLSDCSNAGVTAQQYTLSAADVGKRVRVRIQASNAPGPPAVVFRQTSVILAPSSPPPSTPSTFPNLPPSTPGPSVTGPEVLSPFPRIGIAGRARRSSTRLTKLLVRAPRGSRITVRCRGRGCPFRRASVRAGRRAVRFRRLQRSLRRGTVIEVFITSRGKVGKYARFRLRRRKAPSRVDACVQPGARRPSPCP